MQRKSKFDMKEYKVIKDQKVYTNKRTGQSMVMLPKSKMRLMPPTVTIFWKKHNCGGTQ